MRPRPTKKLSVKDMVRVPAVGLVMTVLGLVPMTAMGAVTPPSSAYAVGSATSGICMQASAETSGAAVVLDNCNNQIDQKWYTNRAGYASNGAIAYDIETAAAGSFQCIGDANGVVDLGQCNGVNPAMRFVWNGNQLENIGSGECLDSSTVGAQLVIDTCDSSASSQLWFGVANKARP